MLRIGPKRALRLSIWGLKACRMRERGKGLQVSDVWVWGLFLYNAVNCLGVLVLMEQMVLARTHVEAKGADFWLSLLREGSVYSFGVAASVAIHRFAVSTLSGLPLNLLRNRFRKKDDTVSAGTDAERCEVRARVACKPPAKLSPME